MTKDIEDLKKKYTRMLYLASFASSFFGAIIGTFVSGWLQ